MQDLSGANRLKDELQFGKSAGALGCTNWPSVRSTSLLVDSDKPVSGPADWAGWSAIEVARNAATIGSGGQANGQTGPHLGQDHMPQHAQDAALYGLRR